MTKLRTVALAASATAALAAAGAAPAAAATSAAHPAAAQAAASIPAKKAVPVTGQARNGKKFTGTFHIHRFVSKHGKTYAVGTLTGKLKGRHITRYNVAIPATLTGAGGARVAQVTPATCPILHLTLGPLDLNLLGLHVTLNQVVLDITAIPGAGNLLGNLLCAVTNLLNPGGILGGLSSAQLAAILNAILALLG